MEMYLKERIAQQGMVVGTFLQDLRQPLVVQVSTWTRAMCHPQAKLGGAGANVGWSTWSTPKLHCVALGGGTGDPRNLRRLP